MEVEAKFAAADERVLERLAAAGVLGGCSLGPVVTREVDDTYLDTPDRALLAWGCTCRHRETEDAVSRRSVRSGGQGFDLQQPPRALITVKSIETADKAVFSREEFEVEVGADRLQPHEWPDSRARARVNDVVGGRALVPLLRLSQVRRTRLLSCAGRTCAELFLDRVRVTGRVGVHRFFEVELELAPDGSEAEFRSACEALAAEAGLMPSDRPKFLRALALLEADAAVSTSASATAAPGPPHRAAAPTGCGHAVAGSAKEGKARPGVRSTDTMAEAADKILSFHLERMIEHEEGTRLGEDIEELHDMRVATRRMRAAFRLLTPFLDADSTRPFVKALRRTGRSLGAVRDLDVFRQKADAYLRGLPEGHDRDLAPLFATWQGEYARHRAGMLTYLDGSRYRAFREDFSQFLSMPGAGALPVVFDDGRVRPYRVRDVLPYLVYEHAAEVWAYDGHMTDEAPVPLVRFHRLRIAAKALRYSLEFFQEVLGPEAKDLISATKRLQDHLGDLQDAVVACDVLQAYLTWGSWGTPPADKRASRRPSVTGPGEIGAPGVAALLAVRRAELQDRVDTFPEAWADVTGSAFRHRLAAVLTGV